MFQLMLPAITMFFFCLCIGNEIKGLNLAVYNGEVNYYNYSHGFFRNLEERDVNLVSILGVLKRFRPFWRR